MQNAATVGKVDGIGNLDQDFKILIQVVETGLALQAGANGFALESLEAD